MESPSTSQFLNRLGRICLFVVCTAAIWAGYFWWRPPGPILGLHHIEHLSPDSNQVAITFDDAPHPLTTPLLLAALSRAEVHATFFVVGDGLRMYPELARRIQQAGHTLANHSQYHRNLTRINRDEYSREVDACFAEIRRNGGNTHLFRPPGGGLNRQVMQYLYDNDVTLAWWSNNCGDWARPAGWKIVDEVKAHLRPGDIILLHDASGGFGTPQAVPTIVREARRRGFTFVSMPER